MKKHMAAVLLSFSLALSAVACGREDGEWDWKEEYAVEDKREGEEAKEAEASAPAEAPMEDAAREAPAEATAPAGEAEAPGEEAEPAAREDYCYAAMLTLMSRSEEMANCFGIERDDGNSLNADPSQMEFAMEDIDSDGVKELLVRYDNLWEGRSVNGYRYGKLCQTANGNAEFLGDGWVLDWDKSREYAQIRTGLAARDASVSVFAEQSELENWLEEQGEDAPSIRAEDGAPVYVWYYQYQDGSVELIGIFTREEHEARLRDEYGGTVSVSWKPMTGGNIGALIHARPEDGAAALAAEGDTPLARYIYNMCEASGWLGRSEECLAVHYDEYSLNGVLSNLMYWNAMEVNECLPSAKIVSEEDNLITYEVDLEDYKRWCDEAFAFYSMEELTEYGNEYFWENGDGTVTMMIDWLNGEGNGFQCDVISAERRGGHTVLKGVVTSHYGDYRSGYYEKGGYYFECELEENPASPMNGYRVIDIKTDHIFFLTQDNLYEDIT